MKKYSIFFTLALIFPVNACMSPGTEKPTSPTKPNILMICVDDLRPELNCFGADHIVSPNIDALAEDGMLFSRAYTQQAVCAPSRNTLMTGIRPDGLGIYDLQTFFRKKAPDVVTLSQHFMQTGYHAEGMGKIYHQGHGNHDDSLSWSRPHWDPHHLIDQREPLQRGDTTLLHTSYPMVGGKRLPWYKSSMPEPMHNDAMVATHAIERMEVLKDKPFFLAVGFVKPHLPFVAPAKYWDLYDHAEIGIPSPDKPDVFPPYAFTNWGELRKYHGIPAKGPLSEADSRNMIHGYYACVSFIDAQVGRLIAKLKELGLYENTMIVIWGDHGWKLGEYGDWCKHTNYELDTRIPVIVRVPWLEAGIAKETSALVETVDIYPTLCDLAGIDSPDHLQGSSFADVLNNPDTKWDRVAFSQYPRSSAIDGMKVQIMGYTMRTDRYRITRWIDLKSGKILDTEVYDHRTSGISPASTKEMTNLAAQPANAELTNKLNRELDLQYEREHGKPLVAVPSF